MLEEVRSAVQVVTASFVYDNAALTDLLVRRLADRSAFDLTVHVDKEELRNVSAVESVLACNDCSGQALRCGRDMNKN